MNENGMVPHVFEGKEVRSVIRDGEPWFVAKDVCEVLGIQQANRSLENFPEDEVLKVSSNVLSKDEREGRGGASSFLVVNEPGLYRLIFQSRKPEAEPFKHWVYHEVLPSIRKTGGYGVNNYKKRWAVRDVVYAASRKVESIVDRWERSGLPFSKDESEQLLEQTCVMRVAVCDLMDLTHILATRVDEMEEKMMAEQKLSYKGLRLVRIRINQTLFPYMRVMYDKVNDSVWLEERMEDKGWKQYNLPSIICVLKIPEEGAEVQKHGGYQGYTLQKLKDAINKALEGHMGYETYFTESFGAPIFRRVKGAEEMLSLPKPAPDAILK